MITVYDQGVCVGECADLFHAFAPLNGQLYCFFRRHRIDDGKRGESALWMAEWTGRKLIRERHLLDGCEDPRVIVHQGEILVFTVCPPQACHVLFSYPSGRTINLVMPEGLPMGKNWQPYSDGSHVMVLHSFQPWRWLDIDIYSGRVSVMSEQDLGLLGRASHDNYSIWRGGSNALRVNGEVRGTGHLTYMPHTHQPFLWKDTRAIFPAIFPTDWGIVDPVSLWESPDGLHLSISCSERDWFSSQRFASYILDLPEEIWHTTPIPTTALAATRPTHPRSPVSVP